MIDEKPTDELLSSDAIQQACAELDGWAVSGDEKEISRTFEFKNFYETMAFVNAAAWVAHGEDHHPEFVVGYKTCKVTYTTHSSGGLSGKDTESAAALNALV